MRGLRDEHMSIALLSQSHATAFNNSCYAQRDLRFRGLYTIFSAPFHALCLEYFREFDCRVGRPSALLIWVNNSEICLKGPL